MWMCFKQSAWVGLNKIDTQIDYLHCNILIMCVHLSSSRPVRYAKWQKMHLRNTCLPFGHTFPLIFYLDGCKLHMIMSMNFHIQKLQIHHSPDFVWCHLSLCSKIFSPPFNSSDNTKQQQQQQQLILCLLRLKAVNMSVHLFLWTGVMCQRMRCITKMLAYRIRKTLLIPSLSWLWFWRIISQPCCMISRWQVRCATTKPAFPHVTPSWTLLLSVTKVLVSHSATWLQLEGAVSDFPDTL